MMCSSPQMMPDGTHAISQANDNIVWKTLFNILETRMKNGEFTVIDATNSKTSEMNRYKKMCDEYRYRIYCVDMTTVPIEVTKERNRGRQELKRVPEEVIDKMYARFETQKIPSGIKVIQPDELNAVFMKKFNLDQYKRIHHIGDIHGCNTALNTYFEANGSFKDDEFYIFCGDYTDRGIENADVLKFLLSTYDKPNVLLLEGNHERWLWDWAHDKVTASKEFNINERPETELDKLQDKLAFPVRAYVKENGYLGIVSNNPETGKLFVTTKSNPEGSYAEWFAEALHTQLGDDTLDKINAYCKEHDVSFVFENVDMERDPHIIKYPGSRVFLLDIVSNDMKFQKLSFEEMCTVAESLKIPHKELGYEIETWQDFFDWYNRVMDEDYKYGGKRIEGFVIEDSNGYMVKLKLAYYNFWKFMRSISHEAIKKGYIDPKRTAALVTPLANQFYAWVKTLHDVEDLDSVPRNICTLRDMFYESDSGKKFKDE